MKAEFLTRHIDSRQRRVLKVACDTPGTPATLHGHMHTGQGFRVLSVSPARERLPEAAAAALEARPLPAAACVYAPCGCMCVRARARACVCVRAMQEHEHVHVCLRLRMSAHRV